MKKIVLIFLIVINFRLLSFDDVEIRLKVTNSDGTNATMYFGVSDTLTDNFDDNCMYEKDMPPFPPGGGIILPYFLIYSDTQKTTLYSQGDFKKREKDSTTYMKKYRVAVLGTSLEDYHLEWFISKDYITKAKIVDEFSGAVIDIDMFKQSTATINKNLKDLFFEITYTNTKTDIIEEQTLTNSIFPNPAKSKINFPENVTEWEIFDLLGNRVAKGNEIITDVSSLSNSHYIVKIKSNDGITFKTLIKE